MRKGTILAAMLAMIGAGALAAQQAPSLMPEASPADAAAPSGPQAPPMDQRTATLTKADADAWLDGFMPYALRRGDVAGAVVAIVRDGQVVTQRGYGFADVAKRRPVDPQTTLFRPGSVSKLVAWTAVMQQVEAGRIDLDADINRYLDFRIPPRDGAPVTMRQLMTHTAGFEDHAKDIIYTQTSNMKSLGDYLKSWVPNRIYPAGTTPAYSNYGTALAGYIVERVSGLPFDDYVEQRIFAPAGMATATFRQPLPARLAPLMATGYRRASDKALPFEIVGPAPAGSLSASGADMARFMIAHLDGGAIGGNRILSPATARRMHTDALTVIPPLNRMMLGFFETNVNGRRVIAHLGDTEAFHSALHLFTDARTGIYLSVNSAGREGAAGAIRSALFTDFADRYFPDTRARPQPIDAETARRHAQMMAGHWQNSRRVATGFMDALALAGQTVVSVDGEGGLVIPALKTAGGATRKWQEIAPFVWREVGGQERLAAVVEGDRVVRWSVDGFSPFMVFDRVPTARSAAWILPALYAALAILLVAALHWPVAAMVRRHYARPLALTGPARRVYRLTRLFAALVLVMLAGWAVQVSTMMSELTALTAASDPALWFLQVVGLVVFTGAVAVAAWNAWLAFAQARRWTGKLGAVLILLATLMVLYVAAVFGLLDMTVNY